MKSKVSFLVVIGLLFVFLMGCGGTYGGNPTYLTITGSTWTKSDQSSTGDGTALPEQLTFNANSSGSASGGSGVYATADPTFTGSYRGFTLVSLPQQHIHDATFLAHRTYGRYGGKSYAFDHFYWGNSHLYPLTVPIEEELK